MVLPDWKHSMMLTCLTPLSAVSSMLKTVLFFDCCEGLARNAVVVGCRLSLNNADPLCATLNSATVFSEVNPELVTRPALLPGLLHSERFSRIWLCTTFRLSLRTWPPWGRSPCCSMMAIWALLSENILDVPPETPRTPVLEMLCAAFGSRWVGAWVYGAATCDKLVPLWRMCWGCETENCG